MFSLEKNVVLKTWCSEQRMWWGTGWSNKKEDISQGVSICGMVRLGDGFE